MSDYRQADPREAKLPVWVQDKLRILRRDLAQAEQDVRTLEGATVDPKATNVRLVDSETRGLLSNTKVEFTPQSNVARSIRRDILVYIEEDHIVIHGGGKIKITPRAANAVWIALED